MKQVFLFLLISTMYPNYLYGSDTIRVTDYGYVVNSRQNAVPAVQKALGACRNKIQAVLIFPPGRYDFWPQYVTEKLYYESNTDVIPLRRCPILLEQLEGLTIEGQQAEFIFHDRMQPITLDHCKNIAIKNLSIDWDIPLTAQAEVMAAGENYIDIKINPLESPFILENDKIIFVGEGWKSAWWGAMEFTRETQEVAPGTGDNSCMGRNFFSGYRAALKSAELVRLYHQFTRRPAVGNYLVMRHSARDHAGIFIDHSEQVSITNIYMYHNAGLGILSQHSTDLTFTRVHCVPNAKKNRLLSGHDDGLHFSNCRGQITVDSCTFRSLMDDPINVHGTSVKVIKKINARQVLCQFMHHQSIGMRWAEPGDLIGLIENETMQTTAYRKVLSFFALNPELFELTLSDTLPATFQENDALENISWTPDVTIRNCLFGSNRARGILVSSPGKIIIEHNYFASSGSAILIAGDANYWFESGAVKDVWIHHNTFSDACLTSSYQFCEGIISIFPEIPRLESHLPFHQNIRIENNIFQAFDYPVLYAKATLGLKFKDNIIRRSTRWSPWHPRQAMISLDACQAVVISGNELHGDVLGRNVKLIGTKTAEVNLNQQTGMRLEN